jgi:hypothetical protein
MPFVSFISALHTPYELEVDTCATLPSADTFTRYCAALTVSSHMGLNQSSPCVERTRPPAEVYEFKPRAADVRKLLLKTLPVFVRAGKQQASLISAQPESTLFENPAQEYLVHLGTASCAFFEYLQLEKLSDKEVECFAPQLSQIASLLNGLLDENFFLSQPAKVRISQTYISQR